MRRFACALLLATVGCTSGCKEKETIDVHSLKFVGVKAIDESALRAALATTQSSKVPWGPKRFFDRAQLEADLPRIQAFYTDRGYPRARVVDFEAKLNDKEDRIDITVRIEEGEPLRVSSVNFTGFDVIPARHLAIMQRQVPLKVGTPRNRQYVVTTHEMAVNELRDHGFPNGKVDIQESPESDRNSVALTFAAEPGALLHFGPVEISGVHSVGENVVRRELAYAPGDLYRRSLVQETQRRLYDMRLFQFVNVESLTPDQRQVPTRVTLAEGRHYRVRFGAGYGTEEKVRAEADYHHLNFFGGARSAGIRLRWSALDRGVRIDATQPYFFRPHFSLSGELQQWYTYTPAYRAVTSGGKLVLTHRGDARNSWSASFTNERDQSSIADSVLSDPKLRNDLIALGLDPTTGQQRGTLSSVSLDFHRSTANNILDPRRGYQVALHGEWAGGLLPGTFNYHALSADVRHYLPISERLVYANRFQIGNLTPKGGEQANVPFSKKYFLGGATSVRGWGVYEVSPLSGSGLPIGGDSMLAFSTELRAVVKGNLGGVAFLDAGNVWAGSGMIRFGDLRYAVGPGLRYQTPIGPIRVDAGYQLNPIPGLFINGQPEKRHWRVHFSIGAAF